ncbi:MAG TPA: Uma2 family endonuclease [Enhygromyxa sp.]|nr:Uma2 family endonuclease [Enhygromyxa sp.]
MTAEEYLAMDRAAEVKHEFWDGIAYAMAGASLAHNRLVRNLLVALTQALAGSECEALPSDQRVRVPGQQRYLYPDVTVVCGPPELEDGRADTLLNPRIIIEVLSDSTEAFDRGQKFEAYQAIPSVTEYIVVAQDRMRVDQFIRGANATSWLLRPHAHGSVEIATLGIQLPLASIYAGVLA